MRAVGRTLRRLSAAASLALLCLAIVLSPIPFGSVGIHVIVVWVAVLGLSAVFAAFVPVKAEQARLLLPLWAFCGCWVVVLWLQNTPQAALDHPIWAEASGILGGHLQAVPAALKSQSLLAQGPPLVAVLTLSCAIVLGSNEERARLILGVFAWSGLAYAVFGIISYLIDPSKILGFDKVAYLGELTATFYNRNTAAIYFGCCSIAWLMPLAETIRKARSRRGKSGAPARAVAPKWLLPAIALAICITAMFMTRSRAGSLASIVGLSVALIAFFYRSFPTRASLLAGCAGIVIAIGLAIPLLAGGVAERLSVDGVSDVGRWEAYRSTLQIVQSAPWLGSGLGSYPWVFPAYRSPAISTWGVWDRAHNTYLELMAEVGIPMAILLALGWLAMLAMLVRGVAIRRRGVARPVAALGILASATLHTMVDFPLQIPAFSIAVFAITGIGLAQSFRPDDGRAKAKEGNSDRNGGFDYWREADEVARNTLKSSNPAK